MDIDKIPKAQTQPILINQNYLPSQNINGVIFNAHH